MATASLPLSGKTVLIGVTGSIAAFRAADLVSRLRKDGADIHVLMTPAATRFVTPLTFAALSHHPVLTDLFNSAEATDPEHVELSRRAAVYLIAPTTANTLAKLAQGIADDPVTTTYLAVACPVIVAPAMNDKMWSHPAVQANVKTLSARKVQVVEPEEGILACGAEGQGRLASVDRLYAAVQAACRARGAKSRKDV